MSSAPELTPSGMSLQVFNEEVLFADLPLASLDRADIEWLKARAARNARRRIRICAHRNSGERLHEMIIVHARDTYVRPHMHLNRSESFHVISGAVDVVLFGENGEVREVVQMADYASGKRFFYRLNESRIHTLLIRSEVLVFQEVTSGPFRRDGTLFPAWGPEEAQTALQREFLDRLEREVARLLAGAPVSI